MKILCLTQVTHLKKIESTLFSIGDLYYYPDIDKTLAKKLIFELKPDVLFVSPNSLKYKIDKNILQYSSVQIICTVSTGTDHIDLDYCKKNRIKIISLTKEYKILNNITSTAEMAFGLLLSLVRHIPKANQAVQEYNWNFANFIGKQLAGMTIGIVGYGRLGSMMANYCNAFNMKIVVYDPYKKSPFKNVSLHKLCKISNAISLHVHLSKDTENLISRKEIEQMSNCYLVNTSRGRIVNEKDILWGLSMRHLDGYATDVIADELGDIKNSCIIKNAKKYNIIITPHIGGATYEAQSLAFSHICKLLEKEIKKRNCQTDFDTL